jgi:hypothetical protein
MAQLFSKNYKDDIYMNADNILILDDLLDQTEQGTILKILADPLFPWFASNQVEDKLAGHWGTNSKQHLLDTSAKTDNVVEHIQLTHAFVQMSTVNSKLWHSVSFLPVKLQTYLGRTLLVQRLKANLQPAIDEKHRGKYNIPHRDHRLHPTSENDDHWIMIYYAVDSDGPTYIFDQTFESTEKLTIKETVQPKQGRAVIFNNKYWHAGMHPIDSPVRLVLNMNFTLG